MSGPEFVEPVAADCRNNVPVDVRGISVQRAWPHLWSRNLLQVRRQPFGHRHAAGRNHLPLSLRLDQSADLRSDLSTSPARDVLAMRLAIPVPQEHRSTPAPVRKLVDRPLTVTAAPGPAL